MVIRIPFLLSRNYAQLDTHRSFMFSIAKNDRINDQMVQEAETSKLQSPLMRLSSCDGTNNADTKGSSNPISQPSANIPFPWKLHRILDDADANGFNDIISWVPTENGFKVHKTKAFDTEIMPRYFNNTKYKSFQRQLNMWGFDRVGNGPYKGAYLHHFFIRGKPELCESMQRTKIKGIHSKKLRKGKVGNELAMESNHSRSSVLSNDSCNSTRSSCDVQASFKAAAQRVADLELQKEEIQRKLQMVSTNTNAAAASDALSNMTALIPQISLHSQPNQESQDPDMNSEDLNPLPIGQGDILLFGGQNFYFVEDGKLAEGPNTNDQSSHTRRVTRRYSLEPAGPNSEEYILRELDQVIGGDQEMNQNLNCPMPNGENNTHDHNISYHDTETISPTPLPFNHRNVDQIVTATAYVPNCNTGSPLIIGFDEPTRRFSFLSTPVVNPLDKPYQIPPRPSAVPREPGTMIHSDNQMAANNNALIANMNNLMRNSSLRNGPTIRDMVLSGRKLPSTYSR